MVTDKLWSIRIENQWLKLTDGIAVWTEPRPLFTAVSLTGENDYLLNIFLVVWLNHTEVISAIKAALPIKVALFNNMAWIFQNVTV